MPNSPSLESLRSNADFLGLPTIEKRRVMIKLYPDFGGLPIQEQSRVIESFTGRGGSREKPPRSLAALPSLGAAAGAMTTGPLAPVGAALGGIAGKALEETIESRYGAPVPQTAGAEVKSLAKAGAEQAAYEAGGRYALSPLLKGAGRLIFRGTKNLPLASGAEITTTPGMRSPIGALAKFESGAAAMPSGKPLREAYTVANEQIRNELVEIAKRSAKAGVTSSVPDEAFNQASLAVRKVASPLHEQVLQSVSAVVQGRTVDPVAQTISDAAKVELHRLSTQSMLTRPEVRAVVQSNLERLSFTNIDLTALKPGEAFNAFKDSRSAMLDLMETAKLSRNERRIVHGILDKIDDEIVGTIRKIGGPRLEATWREANRLTAQSYGLEKVRDAVRKSMEGSRVQLPGTKPIPQVIKGRNLEAALEKLSTVDRPGSKSALTKTLSSSDEATIRQLANALRRVQTVGGGSNLAVKFRTLAGVELAGGAVIGTVTGSPGAGVAAAVAPEVGAYIFAKAMTSAPGRNAVLRFMSSPSGTAAELQAAGLIYKLTSGEDTGLAPVPQVGGK